MLEELGFGFGSSVAVNEKSRGKVSERREGQTHKPTHPATELKEPDDFGAQRGRVSQSHVSHRVCAVCFNGCTGYIKLQLCSWHSFRMESMSKREREGENNNTKEAGTDDTLINTQLTAAVFTPLASLYSSEQTQFWSLGSPAVYSHSFHSCFIIQHFICPFKFP